MMLFEAMPRAPDGLRARKAYRNKPNSSMVKLLFDPMKIAIAADHAGFSLKETLRDRLQAAGHDLIDFGASLIRIN